MLAASPAVLLLRVLLTSPGESPSVPHGSHGSLRDGGRTWGEELQDFSPATFSPGALRLFQPFPGMASIGHPAERPFSSAGSAAAEAGRRSRPPRRGPAPWRRLLPPASGQRVPGRRLRAPASQSGGGGGAGPRNAAWAGPAVAERLRDGAGAVRAAGHPSVTRPSRVGTRGANLSGAAGGSCGQCVCRKGGKKSPRVSYRFLLASGHVGRTSRRGERNAAAGDKGDGAAAMAGEALLGSGVRRREGSGAGATPATGLETERKEEKKNEGCRQQHL